MSGGEGLRRLQSEAYSEASGAETSTAAPGLRRMRVWRLLPLLPPLLIVGMPPVTESQRSIHSFDSNWLFHLGDAAKQELCPGSAFEEFKGMYCPTWGHQAAYDITEDECKRYCCGDSSCAGWNYNGRWCSLGNSRDG